MLVPFAPPNIGEAEVEEVVAALRSGWLTTGPRVAEFETRLGEYVRAPSALAVNSGTAAMHVALAAFGIGPGDEVITSTMTFCSTAHVIDHCGATPVFADVERDTLNLDPQHVAELLDKHPRVRAVIPVHYAGHPCDMEPIFRLAEEHGLLVLEDAAHALGASYLGRRVGGVDSRPPQHCTAFSFYATKNLCTGEGGMLTGSDELVEAARVWTLHGMTRDAWSRYDVGGSWRYDVVAPGFKYNMADIQAALGLRQLQRFELMQQRRVEIAARYHSGLAELPQVGLPTNRPDVTPALHLYPIRLRLESTAVDREGLIADLSARGVATSVHFIPLHLMTYYRDRFGFKDHDFPVAYEEFQRLVSLPFNSGMSDDDVDYVINSLAAVLKA